uniref:Uncharacterized protein n=1 Tax=Anguilla anguilla TaxID=7936 RepID=A0A0E9SIM6_ANGAN
MIKMNLFYICPQDHFPELCWVF